MGNFLFVQMNWSLADNFLPLLFVIDSCSVHENKDRFDLVFNQKLIRFSLLLIKIYLELNQDWVILATNALTTMSNYNLIENLKISFCEYYKWSTKINQIDYLVFKGKNFHILYRIFNLFKVFLVSILWARDVCRIWLTCSFIHQPFISQKISDSATKHLVFKWTKFRTIWKLIVTSEFVLTKMSNAENVAWRETTDVLKDIISPEKFIGLFRVPDFCIKTLSVVSEFKKHSNFVLCTSINKYVFILRFLLI